MESEKLRATPAARSLAKKMGVELDMIVGSGKQGRIQKEDIESFSFSNKGGGITPLARKIAEAHGIDYSNINGSGFRGQIRRRDIMKLVGSGKEVDLSVIMDPFTLNNRTKVSETHKEVSGTSSSSTTNDAIQNNKPSQAVEFVPMNMMRRVIAKRMSDSYFSAPTFVLNYEVDMTEAIKLRKQILEPIKEKTGKKITVTDIISLAVVRTLMNHPYINASLSSDGSQIELHNYVNLAMAVGMDEGLLVPVVHNAQNMSLTELMLKLKDITERAVGKKLTPQDQEGSTFTISNLGMYGVESFTSIINQPNSAILSIASTKEMPVVRNGEIVVRSIMKMSLTSDHRVINGLAAAKFMQELKNSLENPLPLLV